MTGTKISNDDDGSDGTFIPVTGSCLVTVNDGVYLACVIFLTSQVKIKKMK